jgi:hypothetical protein
MDLQLPPLLKTVLPFFHPLVMWGTLALALYALYLGLQVRRIRSADTQTRKKLIAAKPSQKHFIVGSSFLVLIVLGTIGGMAVTYINNGKLFVGPHLLAGLGVMALAALSAGLAPFMQQGNQFARNLHLVSNAVLLAIFGWQAVTGVQIIQRILTQAS